MKKLLLFVTMAASLLFTQCKKEDSVSSAGKTVSMTVTAGPGSKTDITDAGAITWSTGDKLYVGDGSKYIGYLTIASGVGSATGTFSGSVELTDADEGDELTFYFYYLGSETPTGLAEGATSVDVEFDDQTGLLGDLGSCHVGYGSATGTVINDVVTDINVTMLSKVAIARFCFTKENSKEAYEGALTLKGDNICNKMTVNFNSEVFACEGTKGDISLTNTTTSEKYVMLVPTDGTTGEQALTFAGDNVSGSYTLANGIEANKFYGLTGAIAVTLEAAGPTHEYVDLGLPSGLLWATCNVGADSPEKYGDYYAWGETATKSDYTWSTYGWCNGSYETLTKYNDNSSYGTVDNKTTLELSDDAARANWGGDWRMPTEAEFTELINNTTQTWYAKSNTEFNGVAGYKFVSNKEGYTDKYIFLPAAGYRNGKGVLGAGSYGSYWSSSLDSSYPTLASYMYFNSGNVDPQNYNLRYYGFSVRPVRPVQ